MILLILNDHLPSIFEHAATQPKTLESAFSIKTTIKKSPFGKQGILSFFEFSHKEKQNLVYVLVD